MIAPPDRCSIAPRALVALAVLVACMPAGAAAQAVAWAVDSASVTFEIRNAGLPVRGSFGGVEATICFDPSVPEAGMVIASVDPSTVQTGIGMRDRHLQRRGYFEVAKYGRVEIRSVRLRASGRDFAGTFVLRIRDVEREVEVPFAFEASGARARIAGSFTLDRRDYGLGPRNIILADDVTIGVELALQSGASVAPDDCARVVGA